MPLLAPKGDAVEPRQVDEMRRPRGSYERSMERAQSEGNAPAPDESSVSPKTGAAERPIPVDHLRSLRLALFQQDQRNLQSEKMQQHKDVVSLKYSRALEDLAVQGKLIQRLQNELKDTTLALEQTQRELQQSKAESAKRSHTLEETSAKIFHERIEVEEELRLEKLASQRVKEQLRSLTKEVARLNVALQQAQEANAGPVQLSLIATKSAGSATVNSNPQAPRSITPQQPNAGVAAVTANDSKHETKVPGSEETRKAEQLSADLLALRSDVVDLRAQLAETRAERISSGLEIAQLKQQRDDAQGHIATLNEKLEGMQTESEDLKLRLGVSILKEKEDTGRLKGELIRVRRQLEDSYKETAESAAKSHKLEGEFAEMKIEATKHECLASDLVKQLEQTKLDADENLRVSGREAMKLQNELELIKEKLSQTNSTIISQAAEHLKEKSQMEHELFQTREVAQVLQSKVLSMDDHIADAESEALQARLQGEENEGKTGYMGAAGILEILRNRRPSPSK